MYPECPLATTYHITSSSTRPALVRNSSFVFPRSRSWAFSRRRLRQRWSCFQSASSRRAITSGGVSLQARPPIPPEKMRIRVATGSRYRCMANHHLGWFLNKYLWYQYIPGILYVCTGIYLQPFKAIRTKRP